MTTHTLKILDEGSAEFAEGKYCAVVTANCIPRAGEYISFPDLNGNWCGDRLVKRIRYFYMSSDQPPFEAIELLVGS